MSANILPAGVDLADRFRCKEVKAVEQLGSHSGSRRAAKWTRLEAPVKDLEQWRR